MSIISIEILKKNIPFYDILKNIEENHNAKIYIVGGCIRDILLNIPLHDIDIVAENIEYTHLSKILGKHLKAYAVSFKDNMRIMKDNLIIDISKLRGLSIYEDVQKRDFTINNLACSLDGNIIGSDADINNKIIRLVYDNAFDDDAVRIIRAFRFSATLGFIIEENTLNQAYQKRRLIKSCAKERILEELRKMFQGKYLEKSLNYISEYNIFDIFFDASKIDNKKLLSAYSKTYDFALLLSLWCKDYNFIEYLGLTAKEYKQINEYLKIDYNNLKSSDDKSLKYFIFSHADLIKNIIIYIKINFSDDKLAEKLNNLYKELDFNKSKAVNGSMLLSLGFKPSPLFSEIINQVSFLLAINELNKDNIEDYIKNRWC
ncbi:MAG: hypothetical protein SPF17_07915 [Candidatus Mucispirillum faecigallinarum]|nr:hypothetical protein [Candidatus Mucispirillum faecigallinarum]